MERPHLNVEKVPGRAHNDPAGRPDGSNAVQPCPVGAASRAPATVS